MNFKSYLNCLNIADWFSVARIILFLPLLVFIFTDERLIFTWLLLIAFLTDAIDGILARRLKIVTKRGAHLDSVGDRLTLLAAFLGVWFFEKSFVLDKIELILIPASLYLIQSLVAFIRFRSGTSFHTYSAKITFLLLAVFTLWLFFFGFEPALFYFTLIVGITNLIEENILTIIVRGPRVDIKGLYWFLKN